MKFHNSEYLACEVCGDNDTPLSRAKDNARKFFCDTCETRGGKLDGHLACNQCGEDDTPLVECDDCGLATCDHCAEPTEGCYGYETSSAVKACKGCIERRKEGDDYAG